jgi:hypothetical protein
MIISGLIYMGAALAGFVVALRGLELLFASPSKALKLTVFRQYRGREAWPQGVQEEDSVRFDFSKPTPPPPPIVPGWDDIVVTGSGLPATSKEALSEAVIEESPRESVVVEPLHAEVHRSPH